MFGAWHFPALGEGVVDFPACVKLLNRNEFSGPYTLELEGIEGEEMTPLLAKSRVEASLEYLRRIGLVE